MFKSRQEVKVSEKNPDILDNSAIEHAENKTTNYGSKSRFLYT